MDPELVNRVSCIEVASDHPVMTPKKKMSPRGLKGSYVQVGLQLLGLSLVALSTAHAESFGAGLLQPEFMAPPHSPQPLGACLTEQFCRC